VQNVPPASRTEKSGAASSTAGGRASLMSTTMPRPGLPSRLNRGRSLDDGHRLLVDRAEIVLRVEQLAELGEVAPLGAEEA
jgi:hypothetical protein